jgi:hypothetical protein
MQRLNREQVCSINSERSTCMLCKCQQRCQLTRSLLVLHAHAWHAYLDPACIHWQADNNVRQSVAKIDMEVIPKSKDTTTMYTYIMCGGSMTSQQGDVVPTPSPTIRSVTPTSTPVRPTAAPVSRAPTPAPSADDTPGKRLFRCSSSCYYCTA